MFNNIHPVVVGIFFTLSSLVLDNIPASQHFGDISLETSNWHSKARSRITECFLCPTQRQSLLRKKPRPPIHGVNNRTSYTIAQ